MIFRRMLAGAVAAALTIQLPSCGFSASVENMLSPPRLTAEQEQIYQALQISAGSQKISLKYPKSGERLSAFIVEDLDGDGSDEAIVFYETGRSAPEENPLRICLLDQKNGAWREIFNDSTAGAELDRVDIAQLGTNPRKNLIVSYSMVDGAEHAAEVYHYDNAAETLARSLSVQYSVMAVRDLNLDGTVELFLASAAKSPLPAMAAVYALGQDGNYAQSQINLPDTFSDISRLIYGTRPIGKGNLTEPVLYMDGITGATLVQTVILRYQENLLWLEYSDSVGRFPNTERSGGFQTMDIDLDGEPEIPVNSQFYGYSNMDAPIRMTNWYVCRNHQLMREHSSYYAVQDGYVFVLPRRWERCVTAVPENEEIVFYEFEQGSQTDTGEPLLKEPLLRLAAVTDSAAADAMQSDGYLLLRQQNGRYYLGRPEAGSRTLSLTESELLTAMRFLN